MRRELTALAVALALLGADAAAAQTPPSKSRVAQKRAAEKKELEKKEPEKKEAEKKEPEKKDATKAEASGKSQPVTVDADKMERFGKEGLVVFSGNVVARQNNSVQYADRMEVYLDERGDRIVRTVSTGSVKIITRDCRTGTAKRAEYHDLEQRLVLSGGARVWEDENVVTGETITMYLSQDKSVVEGGKQDRVKLIFHPKDSQKDGAAALPKKDVAKAACAS